MGTIEIKTKGVSFNILDPDQEALLQHAMKRKNFSAYVKRLIQRDMDAIEMGVIIKTAPAIEERKKEMEAEVTMSVEAAHGFI